MMRNRQVRLAARPVGLIKESDFTLQEADLPALADGEFLVRNIYLSLDPTMRVWMTDRPSYLPPVAIGEVMRGGGIGEIVQSKNEKYEVGAIVDGMIGWQDYTIASGDFQVVPKDVPLTLAMGVLGMTGLSAYFGLLDIGKPKVGDTVIMSGAAGAVGSIAGQIAKIKGCRVIGIAGSDDKCAWAKGELGFDECINYRTESVPARLKELCPKGVDIYFDNVGGDILNAVLARLRLRARIVLCGGISSYSTDQPVPGPSNYLALVSARAKMEGFLIFDYAPRFAEARAEMKPWIAEGKLKSRVDVVNGLENAPTAIRRLFEGENTGKLMVKIADEK
ncbi:MAG: NADP-dependent oxidoreductase [Polyangiaceae bacterium]